MSVVVPPAAAARARRRDSSADVLSFDAHLPPVTLPAWPPSSSLSSGASICALPPEDLTIVTTLPRPPDLAPVTPVAVRVATSPSSPPRSPAVGPPTQTPPAPPSRPAPSLGVVPSPVVPTTVGAAAMLVGQRRRMAAAHQQFLFQQAALHQRFLETRQRTQRRWLHAREATNGTADVVVGSVGAPATPTGHGAPPRANGHHGPNHGLSSHHHDDTPDLRVATDLPLAAASPPRPGFRLDRDGLMVHAGGNISEIFGDLFRPQDAYPRVTRMPLPPLLLADRMTGIDAVPGSMGTGSIWTETDVREDSWYLHDGRMPGGLMIESGQADLMLISYLGVDLLNRGERIYRLLGCELTYHGPLPQPGETLAYDIHIDGHAAQGDVRLFFFHYDCHVAGARRLSVRSGQAGYFTTEELADSAGILWRPETGEHCEDPTLDPPPQLTTFRRFDAEQVRAFADRRPYDCFGPGFERTRAHTRTPAIASGRMLFLDEVTHFEPRGGPWGRGYLRAVDTIDPDDWFFEGHFLNDPCMPGTLMFDGCMATMAIYLAALGFTIDRDGWRFEPVPEQKYVMRCRGQVTPQAQELVYEVFVEEVIDGDTPTLYADLLCTVDGLGAFHCRRMGLRLVPDWPMDHILKAEPELLSRAPGDVAEIDGFRFDHDSLLACAWGRPSRAFGPMYRVFDGPRRVARLPGPPYHFMTRVAQIDAVGGAMEPGGSVVVEYDIPADAWYFERGAPVMPFAVLLEAALQPCGWLASFVGSALTSDTDLAFRNLDGTGTLHAEVRPDAGTLRTRTKIVSIASSAGMIIESFEVQCFAGDTLVYEMDTVFGFFPQEALDAQSGLPVPDRDADVLEASSPLPPVDLTRRPERYFDRSCHLASPRLMMIDRVTGIWREGGDAGLGKYRAESDVDAGAWFFKAHFFQDPVQPGSLGIEAMIQLLQFAMLDQGLDAEFPGGRFEPLGLGTALTWKYRGQVRTHDAVVHCVVELTEVGHDEENGAPFALATASLWADGMRIYEAKNLGMRIVPGPPDEEEDGAVPPRDRAAASEPRRSTEGVPGVTTAVDDDTGGAGEEVLRPDGWLADHCPTFTVPALPMMSMVDRMGAAGARTAPGLSVVGIDDVQVARWLPVTAPVRMKADVDAEATEPGATEPGATEGPSGERSVAVTLSAWRVAPRAELSRFEPVARGRVTLSREYPKADERMVPPLTPLDDAVDIASPYADGSLFHGPRFQKMRALRRGSTGATGVLDATPGEVSLGLLNQVLLDAATHPIPHDRLDVFSTEMSPTDVGYPYRLTGMRFFRPPPVEGTVRAEVRFDGFDGGEPRFPAFMVQLHPEDGDGPWCVFRLVEVLLPKGPLGVAPPAIRRAFLRDRRPSVEPWLGLSSPHGDATRATPADLKASDWLPGTVAATYRLPAESVDPVADVAVKDHVGRMADVHPSTVNVLAEEPRSSSAARDVDGSHIEAVSSAQPLTRHPLALERGDGGAVVVRSAGAPTMDLTPVRAYWSAYFGLGRWPVEDLYYGLIERFIGRVHVVDPEAMAAIRGRGILYLANHQVAVESLLFSVIASGLNHAPTVTLAKAEHRTTWLGRLIQHCFQYPGVVDPEVITYFDRDDPTSLPGLIDELARDMAAHGKSVMVHVEGTRALSCRTPVYKMTSKFVDMALATRCPVVPVRFVGGLPATPLRARIEFPVGHGRQDIFFGRPIHPEDFEALPYRERKQLVIDGINALGPDNATEQPHAGDPRFAARVAARGKDTDASPEHATLFEVLAERPDLGRDAAALVAGFDAGGITLDDDARGHWMAELARRLYGARGPAVTLR
ncbi:MAG: 1-acyl-sn-glycerol-3-phosphate acyltransferase [Myxococcota bacterium]